jgi:hypothetical protein
MPALRLELGFCLGLRLRHVLLLGLWFPFGLWLGPGP